MCEHNAVLLTVIRDGLTIVAHLEERGLGGIQASVARGDNDINWSNQPNTSRSTNLFWQKHKKNDFTLVF